MYQFAEHGDNSDNYKLFLTIIMRMEQEGFEHRAFRRDFIESFWPARGVNDFQNLALAVGGHRPEPEVKSLSYAEAFAADNNLTVRQTPDTGDYIFSIKGA